MLVIIHRNTGKRQEALEAGEGIRKVVGAMKCRQAKKLLSPYLDDELSAKEKAALEEHLRDCPACQAELGRLRKISEGLKGIYREVKPPPDFLDRVMARIEEIEKGGAYHPAEGKARWVGGWRKLALAAALTASLGLFTLHYSRAGTGSGPSMWPGPGNTAAPGTTVIAENHGGVPVGKKTSAGEQEQAAGTAAASGAKDQAGAGSAPGEPDKKATGQGGAPGAATDKRTVSAAAGEKPREQGKDETRVASGEEAAARPQAFLSKNRHVRTTMLKVEVDDLAYAKEVVAMLAGKAGGGRPREMWVYQQEEAILRAVLPVGRTGEFLEKVAALGREIDRERETLDITAAFDRKLLEYQELAGKKDSESLAMAKVLEQQLQDLDRETLEAGNEVVNVWLKLR
ncbi:MAG: zf-HC2 domain-containing protein [Thermoanaerobacteraceae bacterium]|nr:zf-HC2 domain-containing protein [Thermoanaerobacteraceae bacterium]